MSNKNKNQGAKEQPKQNEELEELASATPEEEIETLEELSAPEETTEETVTEESTQEEDSQEEATPSDEESVEQQEHPADQDSVTPESEATTDEDTTPEDKYAAAREIGSDESYVSAKAILSNPNLTIDDKIEELSNTTSVDYKMIIEAFKDYDTVVQQEQLNLSNPKQFASKVAALFNVFNTVLSLKDEYECFLKLQMLVLLVRKYLRTSLQPSFYCLYADDYPGSEIDYLNYTYILAALIAISSGDGYDRVRKTIDFSRSDFVHGRRLEEFAISLS
jgi:hypothetical protein|nr:MAG TPA: hypothetical protein [Caudoviricetes sp.]